MKKSLIWILLVIVVVSASIIGTLAYLANSQAETNVMTMGKIGIKIVEYEREEIDKKGEDAVVQTFNDNKLLIPSIVPDGFDYSKPAAYVNWDNENNKIKPGTGYTSKIWEPAAITNEVDKMVFVENTGKSSAYVRLFFAFEAGNYVRVDRFKEMVHLNLNSDDWTWEWIEQKDHVADIGGTKYFIAMATCNTPIEAGKLSPISLSQIALDPTAKNGDAMAFGEKYDVKVFAQGIQADGFQDFDYTPATALTEAFGTTVPFEGVTYVPFTDLSDAIHRFNGDRNGTDITSNVTSVTFGLTEKYKDEVAGREGVLVANKENEADFTAYAYYVPNGENYDIYVLADNWEIYTPNNSSYLFNDMRVLTKVDTSNLNVSETRNMEYMFHACPKLSDLDVSRWDVSKVTNFKYFLRCAIDTDGKGGADLFNDKLTSLDVSNWNTESATNMSSMFYCCRALASLDVSDWNVSKTTNMSYMFYSCKALTSIDVKDWDVSKVTDMMYMFAECEGFTTIDFAGWDVSSVTKMGEMFWGCGSLTNLDLSTWNTSSLKSIEKMFQGCGKLTDLNISTWDVSKVTNMKQVFYSCDSLPSLDISRWDMSSATTMSYMFYACHNLVELKLPEECNLSNLTSMAAMFKDCHKLASLDLSGWDTGEVTTMHEMFVSCKALSSLKLPNDVSKVTTMQTMFNDCSSLKSLDLSSWNVGSVTNMAGMFSYCSALESLNVSTWNVSEVTDMSNMFERCINLTVLDLSGWKTEKLVNTEAMFRECGKLKTIYVGEYWNMGKVTSSDSMFGTCYVLVGGGSNKKTYSSAHVNATYANYENGYLTYKQYTPTNTTP